MTLGTGLDSAYPPSFAQAQQARIAGYTWWGFYLPKLPNTDPLNSWTPAQVDVLRQAGLQPVPICVPAPPAPADPVQTATEYFNLAKQYGLSPKMAVCYNGEHIQPITGPVWLPVPQPTAPTAVGPGSALQWGGGNFAGLDVDFSVSAPDWPGDTALVADLEANASYTPAWYTSFQATVANLGRVTPPPPPPSSTPLPIPYPVGVKPFRSWQVVVRPNGVWDLVVEGSDGFIYQTFYNPANNTWNGPIKLA